MHPICSKCGWESYKKKYQNTKICPQCGTSFFSPSDKILFDELRDLKKRLALATMNNENVQQIEKRIHEIHADLGMNDEKDYEMHQKRNGRIDKKSGWYRDAPSEKITVYHGGRGG